MTMRDLIGLEEKVFIAIPGMQELLQCSPERITEAKKQYPDAAFALMVANHLSMRNREQNEIHQRAYLAILNGEPISAVRHRYDYDLERYLEQHMWD